MKIELHAHTSEVSPCGTVPAKEVIELYKEKGFDGVVISDHFRASFFKKETDKENVNAFLKETGDEIGVKVYLGAEIKLDNHPANEYLVYGIDEKFLFENARIFELPLEDVRKIVNDYGAVIIQAHPYRNGACEPMSEVDGYEVFNGHFCHHNFNQRAYELALETGKIQTSGSDTHWHCDAGNGGIFVEKLPEQRELGELMKSGPLCITSAMQHIKIVVLNGNAKAEKLDGADAVLCINGAQKPKTTLPVFSDTDADFSEYFANNRYHIFKGEEPTDKFDPSICIGGDKGITAFKTGEERNVSRVPGHYTVTLPENSSTVLEFFGYSPKIVEG